MSILSNVVEQLSSAWVANILSLAAIALSVIALRRSGPRVSVRLKSAIMIGQGSYRWHGRSAVIVTVTNNGSTPVQIQRVSLTSTKGDVLGEPGSPNFAVPCSIEAHGGLGVWLFDRQDLRAAAARDGGEEEVIFKAKVLSGSVEYLSKKFESVHPNEPTQQPKRQFRRMERLRIRISALARPNIQAVNAVALESIHLEEHSYEICVRNYGGGLARGATLELMVDEESGRLKRMAPPIKVPTLWWRRSVSLSVPLQEQEGLTWWVRYRGRASSGIGAMTQAEASRLVEQYGPAGESN